MIPKNTILRLLAEALKTGVIAPSEVEALLPKTSRQRARRVPKNIRDRAASLSEEIGISRDRLRFAAIKGERSYSLYLVGVDTKAVAARRISEPFDGIDDMRRAADIVLARYLETLS